MSEKTVKQGDTVKVLYKGTLEDGTVFDSSDKHGGEPLEFKVGSEQVIPGFENGVVGMKIGEKKTIKIPPEDAYGKKDPNNIQTIPIEKLPKDPPPEEGMYLQLQQQHEDHTHTVVCEIVEVGDEEVKIDVNHPLAGQTLTFEVEISAIQ